MEQPSDEAVTRVINTFEQRFEEWGGGVSVSRDGETEFLVGPVDTSSKSTLREFLESEDNVYLYNRRQYTVHAAGRFTGEWVHLAVVPR